MTTPSTERERNRDLRRAGWTRSPEVASISVALELMVLSSA